MEAYDNRYIIISLNMTIRIELGQQFDGVLDRSVYYGRKRVRSDPIETGWWVRTASHQRDYSLPTEALTSQTHVGSWEGGGVRTPPETSQKYWISSQYWSGSPTNHKATKPAINVGPLSARQRMAFPWRADDGPLLVAFRSSLHSINNNKKKTLSVLDPLWQNFLNPRMRLSNTYWHQYVYT